MTDNPYDLMVPPTRLDRAVDAAIDGENARFERAYERHGREMRESMDASIERFAKIDEARSVVGVHGVVLPVATAAKVIAHLRGEDTGFFTAELLANMLTDALGKVGQ
jgi:hypothetical protein